VSTPERPKPWTPRWTPLIAGIAIGMALSIALAFCAPHASVEDLALIFIPIGGVVGPVSALLGAKLAGFHWKARLVALSSAILAAILVTLIMTIVSGNWVHRKEFALLSCGTFGLAAGALSLPASFGGFLMLHHRSQTAKRANVPAADADPSLRRRRPG